jgi:GNAT superfamily N-acetyltransferase
VTQLPILRPGRDEDAPQFIELMAACWAEYPGCVMDVDGEVPELRALATHYAEKGGALWTAETDGRVVGMVATQSLEDGVWELCKTYVHSTHRGGGIAHLLAGAVERHARAQGATRLKLWSDTRFDRAHRFYEKRGFVRAGPIRALNDLSNSVEFVYAKPLAGVAVEQLDAAGAASAERRLALILQACVEAGASVSFMPPLAEATARGFWRSASAGVAKGERLLFAGWLEGELVGTVQVEFAMAPNQPHRAEISKLLVLPEARRRGLARLLLARAEEAALRAGRTLLTLDTRAGDMAEPLYRSAGWLEAGRIPGFALNAERVPCDTVYFYKPLEPSAA